MLIRNLFHESPTLFNSLASHVERFSSAEPVIKFETGQLQCVKVSAIENMQRPTSLGEIQRFLGTLNHQAKFIPGLSTQTAPLRELLSEKN